MRTCETRRSVGPYVAAAATTTVASASSSSSSSSGLSRGLPSFPRITGRRGPPFPHSRVVKHPTPSPLKQIDNSKSNDTTNEKKNASTENAPRPRSHHSFGEGRGEGELSSSSFVLLKARDGGNFNRVHCLSGTDPELLDIFLAGTTTLRPLCSTSSRS